jgi:hypothetical protein
MRVGEASRRLVLLAAALLALAPSGAAAATVLNGDFESGSLSGWHVHLATEAGNWFAYRGTTAPIGGKRSTPAAPVQAPPQGSFAAVTDEANPDTLILYQDVALAPGSSQQLSLLAYYNTYKPIAVPAPNTLSVDPEVLAGQHNQQFRIDLMKPSAPLESVEPGDILRTIFQTKKGAPAAMSPTKLTADLSPFAGQTVRLRIAVAAHEEVLNAGVDAIALSSASGSNSHAPNRLSLGRARPNRKSGTVTLPVGVPGPGLLKADGQSSSARAAGAGRAKPLRAVKPVTVKVGAGGTVQVHLKPTPTARAILTKKHRLRVKVTVTYRPASGPRETASVPVMFRLAARPHRGH